MDFGNTGALRSPFSPRVRQSIGARRPSSAKKSYGKYMQSSGTSTGDVIYKTALTTVETYGTPLPVMVTEALTFGGGDVSVRVSECGWWWAVCGRRVLVWAHEASSSPARELTLPQTDLAHKADLVMLFYDNDAQMPSCIGVSPEGIVRYWPSVCQSDVYVDVSCELGGQECAWLGEGGPGERLVLATTTCTVVLLQPALREGRAGVVWHTLRPPSGWLGGIGRRVSSLLFGSMPAHVDTRLVGVAVVGGVVALVLAGVEGAVLQLWRAQGAALPVQGEQLADTVPGDPEYELHEHGLRRPLLEAAKMHVQGDMNSVEVSVLEVMAEGDTGLLLLAAIANLARPHDTRYLLAHVCVRDARSPRVTSLAGACWPRVGEPAPRVLPLGARVLLYTQHALATVTSRVVSDKVDYIDVSCEGDNILCAALCGGVPLLFSRKHGVLLLHSVDSLATTPSLCESPMGSPCPSDMYDGNLSLYEIDPNEVSMVTHDACGKLKTAFLFHLRRDATAAAALLHELFPPPPPSPQSASAEQDVDAALDRTVVQIAAQILDDIPAGDPRWKQRGSTSGPAADIALGSSAALQIAAQLRDKQRALSLFVEFLQATALWQRLGLVSREYGGGCVRTRDVLCALGERLAAAVALRRLQADSGCSLLVEAALYHAAEDSSSSSTSPAPGVSLSPADVCYRRVSRVDRVLLRLCSSPVPAPAADTAPTAAALTATHTINVLVEVLQSVLKWRSAWLSGLGADSAGGGDVGAGGVGGGQALPALGSRDLLPALAELHKRALTEFARQCPDIQTRSQLYEAAAHLAELALSDAQRLTHAHARRVYQTIRTETIRTYMEEGQTERASILAEKFKDFELLVEICVENKDLDKLYSYIDKYMNEGMAETTFAWLSERGGRYAALLLRDVLPRYEERAGAWLQGEGSGRSRGYLRALHSGAGGEYLSLARTASTVSSCSTLASLGKLYLLADGSRELGAADELLARCALQAATPRALRVRHGLDDDNAPLLPAEELVQIYIEADDSFMTEFEYKKALDLTEFVQDMERRDDLRLRVWCACAVRSWRPSERARGGAGAESDPRDNMLFRLVDLVQLMGGDLDILLPPVEDILTAPELAELASDPQFHYMIKYGFECVDTTRGNDVMDTCA